MVLLEWRVEAESARSPGGRSMKRIVRSIAVLGTAVALLFASAPASEAIPLPNAAGLTGPLDWLLEPACSDLTSIEAVNQSVDLEIGDPGVRVGVMTAAPTCQHVALTVRATYADGSVHQAAAVGDGQARGFRLSLPASSEPVCVSASASLTVATISLLELDRIPHTGCIPVQPGDAEPDEPCADITDGTFVDDGTTISGFSLFTDEPGCDDAVFLGRFAYGDGPGTIGDWPTTGTVPVHLGRVDPLLPGEPVEDLETGDLDYFFGYTYDTTGVAVVAGFGSTARPHALAGGETYYEVLDEAIDGGIVGGIRIDDECPPGGCGHVRFK